MVTRSDLYFYAFMLWAFLVFGYYFKCEWELSQVKNVAKYEDAFYNQHQGVINQQQADPNFQEAIPLTFPYQETDDLVSLCKQYKRMWTLQYYANRRNLRSYEPSIQTNYIQFKRIAVTRRRPIRIVTVRCSERVAIIEAGDGVSGYILTKDQFNQNTAINVFNITGKFGYKQGVRRILEPVFVVGGAENQVH